MARSGKNIDFSKAKQGKSRQKTRGRASGTAIVLGGRTAHGVSLGRAGNPAGNPRALYDEYGIPRDSKYAGLGPRCRGDVAIALREGFEYQGTSATTEEQVCYGELRRRGFTLGLGTSERSFQPQSPIAGSASRMASRITAASGSEMPSGISTFAYAIFPLRSVLVTIG